jgi:hypothetical protein
VLAAALHPRVRSSASRSTAAAASCSRPTAIRSRSLPR